MAKLKPRGPRRRALEANELLQLSTNWAQLADALLNRFDQALLPGDALQKFRNCRQRQDECAQEYSERLQIIAASVIIFLIRIFLEEFVKTVESNEIITNELFYI
ncbi:hypothetical protein Zmor_014926 [Zophobas morio]|uniref:Retrotransposon gag domain-containing protein n=1 Tax=Zophobas morio TaxID=2755281 RepID=A0AA38IGF0_9CUCU|nr:hypothetical protein Zmor_014926 [Zophobas morio]